MFKTALITATMMLASAPALADGMYPAPPTEPYTAPQVQACNPLSLNVYFQTGESMLSEASLRTIAAASDRLAGCAFADVELVSVAADGRSLPEAAELANARIDMVSAALRDKGVSTANLTTEIDAAPGAPASNRLMARRVEITLAAYRPQIG